MIQRLGASVSYLRSSIVSKSLQSISAIRSASASLGRSLAGAAQAVGDRALGAAQAVGRCFDGIHATCTRIAADIATGVVVSAFCAETAGLGCAMLAGGAGGMVSGMLGCPTGHSISGCGVKGFAWGAAGGAAAHELMSGFQGLRALRTSAEDAGGSMWRRLVAEQRGSIGWGTTVGEKATTGVERAVIAGDEAFHYTFKEAIEGIETSGLKPGSFATPTGSLSPLQAQIDLALPPNRGLTDALLRIDLAGLREAGYELPEITRVGRSFNMPGGGFEMQFPYRVPPEFIKLTS